MMTYRCTLCPYIPLQCFFTQKKSHTRRGSQWLERCTGTNKVVLRLLPGKDVVEQTYCDFQDTAEFGYDYD